MLIHVINPNTTASMTRVMAEAARAVANPGTTIVATEPVNGPVSIEGHFDEALAAVGVLAEIRRSSRADDPRPDAHIVACFGDPGLLAAREMTQAPVIGIAEAAFHMASLIATRFSVVTTLERTSIIAEHLLDQYGMAHRCRRVRAAEIPVLDLDADEDLAFERIIEEARRARDEDRIGAIVLGCGGMASLTGRISTAVGLPVVEGVTSAVKLAESLVHLRLPTSKHGDLAWPRAKEIRGEWAGWKPGEEHNADARPAPDSEAPASSITSTPSGASTPP